MGLSCGIQREVFLTWHYAKQKSLAGQGTYCVTVFMGHSGKKQALRDERKKSDAQD